MDKPAIALTLDDTFYKNINNLQILQPTKEKVVDFRALKPAIFDDFRSSSVKNSRGEFVPLQLGASAATATYVIVRP